MATPNQILFACEKKLQASINRALPKRLTANMKDDCEWMIECSENNAMYGYEPHTLKQFSECARQFIACYGSLGQQFIDLIASIGWARCTEDRDYIQEKWSALEQWAIAS